MVYSFTAWEVNLTMAYVILVLHFYYFLGSMLYVVVIRIRNSSIVSHHSNSSVIFSLHAINVNHNPCRPDVLHYGLILSDINLCVPVPCVSLSSQGSLNCAK